MGEKWSEGGRQKNVKAGEKERGDRKEHVLKKSGVQLLTLLHTLLQKNRSARDGLNWCTHVHIHWWDNWTDWPLKCLLNWPAPQHGNVTSTPSLVVYHLISNHNQSYIL